MALRINYNFESVSAQRNLAGTQTSFFRAIEQLSSGLRINKAADDAAGLAVSEKLKNQVRGLNQAQRNAQDGISLVQTAEGALSETHNILARMRELSIQSANDTLTNSDRLHIQAEVNQLLSEVDRISAATQFNTIPLLKGTGSPATGMQFHVGPNNVTTGSVDEIKFSLGNAGTGATDGGLAISTLSTAQSLTTQSGANAAISVLDTAIESVSTRRGSIGAMQNRLQSTISSLGVGLRLSLDRYLSVTADYGWQLVGSRELRTGHQRFHLRGTLSY